MLRELSIGGGLFQTAGLLEEELFQLRRLAVIKGAEPQITDDHLLMFSRDQLKRATSLTEEDFAQLGKCPRPHNRLGSAYQVAFVRLFDRSPQQHTFER